MYIRDLGPSEHMLLEKYGSKIYQIIDDQFKGKKYLFIFPFASRQSYINLFGKGMLFLDKS